ncbi:MAG: signal peptidase II [Solirubrobacteraceae bacterium]|jgi:signal peptidase II
MSGATLLAAAAAAGALDQASKYLALRCLAARERHAPVPAVGLRLVHTARLGALGLRGGPAVIAWIAVVAVLALVVATAPPGSAQSAPGLAVGLGLALGGATSNLADRLLRGCVVDFIVLWRWPTFNLADAAIVAGVALVAAGLL